MIREIDSTQTGQTKTCFSYIRFSSGKQAKGNSEDRQLEIAPKVARDKGWVLDESLNLADLSLSAFKEANLGPKGKLSGVLEGVKSGKIPRGTVMIIEALDRLTRAELDKAYDLFRDLLRAGLELYVEKGQRHYTRESLKNPIDLLIAIVELNAANAFSALLSERVGKAWKKKREALAADGKRLTKKVPGWLEGATLKPVPERVAIVKRIFKLYDDGIGISSIVKKLNGEKIPTWGGIRLNKKGVWNPSYVSQVLHSRAVIGEFQPHITRNAPTGTYYKRIKAGDPIKDYYPSIISPELFYGVQAKLGDNRKAPRTEKIGNLFSGLAYCKCGQKMYLADSGARKYFMCWGKLKGLGCHAPSMRYEPIEAALSDYLENYPEWFVKRETPEENQTDTLRGKLAEVQSQIDNITKALMISVNEALVLKQADLESEKKTIQEKIEHFHAKTVSGEGDEEQLEYFRKNIRKLSSNLELRRRVQGWLRGNVTRIDCRMVGDRPEVVMDSTSHGIEFKAHLWVD
ncbi:MAG: resolvase-like serine recombinase [Verrucomicrobiales bacterium]|nr:resolvase-like serine recombinase [Verrucomicrobiales bacterium]